MSSSSAPSSGQHKEALAGPRTPSKGARGDVWAVRWATIEEEAALLANRIRELGGEAKPPTSSAAGDKSVVDGEDVDVADLAPSDAPPFSAHFASPFAANPDDAPSSVRCTDVLALEAIVEEAASIEAHCGALLKEYYILVPSCNATTKAASSSAPSQLSADGEGGVAGGDAPSETAATAASGKSVEVYGGSADPSYRPVPQQLRRAHPEALAEASAAARALLAHARAVNARLPMIAVTAARTLHEQLEGEIAKGFGFVAAAGYPVEEVDGAGAIGYAYALASATANQQHQQNPQNHQQQQQQRVSYGGAAFLSQVQRYTDTERLELLKACRAALKKHVGTARAMEAAWALDDAEEAAAAKERKRANENTDASSSTAAVADEKVTASPPDPTNTAAAANDAAPSRAAAIRALIPSAFEGPLYSYASRIAPLLTAMEAADAALWGGKNAAAREDAARLREAAEEEIERLTRLQNYGKEDPILDSPALGVVDAKTGAVGFIPRPDSRHTDLGGLKAKLAALRSEEEAAALRKKEDKRKNLNADNGGKEDEEEELFVVLPAVERRRLLVEQQEALQKEFRRYEGKQFEHEGLAAATDAFVIGDAAYLPDGAAYGAATVRAEEEAAAARHRQRLAAAGEGEAEGGKVDSLLVGTFGGDGEGLIHGESAPSSPTSPSRGGTAGSAATAAADRTAGYPHTLDDDARRFIAKFGPTLFARTKVDAVLRSCEPCPTPFASSAAGGSIAAASSILNGSPQRSLCITGRGGAEGTGGAYNRTKPLLIGADPYASTSTANNASSAAIFTAADGPSDIVLRTPTGPNASRAAGADTNDDDPFAQHALEGHGYDRRDSLMAQSAAEKTLQTRNAMEHFHGPISAQNATIGALRAHGIATLLVPGGAYVLGHLNPKESSTLLPIAESIDKSSRLDRRTNYWLSSAAPAIVAGSRYAGGEQHFMYTTQPRHIAIDDWAVSSRPVTVRQFLSVARDTRVRAEMERILMTVDPDLLSEESRKVFSPVVAAPPFSTSGRGNAAAGGYLEGFISALERRQRDAAYVLLRPGSALAKPQTALSGGASLPAKSKRRDEENAAAASRALLPPNKGEAGSSSPLTPTPTSPLPEGALSPRSRFLEAIRNDPADVGYTDDTIEVPFFIAEAFCRALGGVVCPPDVWEAMAAGAGGDKQRFVVPNLANVPRTLGLHQLKWSVAVDGGHRPVRGSSWRVTEAEGLRYLRAQKGQFGHELIGRCGHEWNQSVDISFAPPECATASTATAASADSAFAGSSLNNNTNGDHHHSVSSSAPPLRGTRAPPIDLRAHYDQKRAAAVPPPTPEEIIAGRRATPDGALVPFAGSEATERARLSASGSALATYSRRHEAATLDDLRTRFSREAQERIAASGLRPPGFAHWRPPHCNEGASGGAASHVLRSATDHLTQTIFSGDVTGVVTFHGDRHEEAHSAAPHARCYDNGRAFVGPSFHTFSLPHHGAPVAAFRIAVPSCGTGAARLREALHGYDRRLGRHVTFADIVRGLGRGRAVLSGEGGNGENERHGSSDVGVGGSGGNGYSPRTTRGAASPATAGGSVHRKGRIGGGTRNGYSSADSGDAVPDRNEGEGAANGGGFSAPIEVLSGSGWLGGVEPDLVVPPGPADDAAYADTEQWLLPGAGIDLCFGADYPHTLRRAVLYGPYKGPDRPPVVGRWMCAPSVRGTAACHAATFAEAEEAAWRVGASSRGGFGSSAASAQALGAPSAAAIVGLDNTGLHGNNTTSYAAFFNQQQEQNRLLSLLGRSSDPSATPSAAAVSRPPPPQSIPALLGRGSVLVGDQRFVPYVAGGGALPMADAAEGIVIRTDSLDGFCYTLPLSGSALVEADDAIRQAHTDNRLFRAHKAAEERRRADYAAAVRAAKAGGEGGADAEAKTAVEELVARRKGRRGSSIAPTAATAAVLPPKRHGLAASEAAVSPSASPSPPPPCCLLTIIEDSSYRLVYTDRVTMRPQDDPRGLLPDIVTFVEITWTKGYDPNGGGLIVTEVSIAPARER